MELKEVFDSAYSRDEKIIFENIHQLFGAIRTKQIGSREDICRWAIEMIIEYLRIFRDEVILEEFFGDQYNMMQDVYKNETIDEVEDWVKSVLTKLLVYMQEKNKKRYSSPVMQAILYISKNYVEDISLENISTQVNMSKNYFSTIFKEETGTNFSTYLAQVRVQHAKKLLMKENYKTYEVANMVGYPNYRYFCKIFKKITGKSPSEIRNGK